MEASRDVRRLVEIMAALRDPVSGCPWDKEQSFSTIAPYTVEEAHEVADAVARGEFGDLRDELGDLLLQVVYHARMAEEIGEFTFDDVVESITAKMIRRHPHVFGDDGAVNAGVAKGFWEKIKAEEKRDRVAAGFGPEELPLLGSVKAGQPGLARAVKLQEKASTVGFDWNDAELVIAKLREETDELAAALGEMDIDTAEIADEIGDLLFTVANLARHLSIDPDHALRRANAKFVRRFSTIERALAEGGRKPEDASLAEMEELWQRAKVNE